MLLTLTTRSLRQLLESGEMEMMSLPGFVMKKLSLRGLVVDADLLAGWGVKELDRFRDRADKAACPCLVLQQHKPLSLANEDGNPRERLTRLATAANRLGCNAVAIRVEGPDNEETFEMTAECVRSLMPTIEQLELNLLIASHEGIAHDAERLTDLIKRIGGFRIGSLPDFARAAQSGDVSEWLRKLAPYAGAVRATIEKFDRKGKHVGYDLAECVRAIRSVGFANTLAIDYAGNGDPLAVIQQARDALTEAIEEEQEVEEE